MNTIKFILIKFMLSVAALASITTLAPSAQASVPQTNNPGSENTPQQQVDGSSLSNRTSSAGILGKLFAIAGVGVTQNITGNKEEFDQIVTVLRAPLNEVEFKALQVQAGELGLALTRRQIA